MKKRTKAALWTAAGCIIVGCILTGAGSLAGGREQLKEINNNAMGVTFEGFSLNVSDANLGGMAELLGDDSVYKGEEETKGQEVLKGDFSRTFSADGLKKLDVTVGVHALIVKEADVNEITVEGKNCDRIQCFVKDGRLVLKDVGRKKAGVSADGRQITLTLPAGIFWEEADVEAAMASVNMDVLNAAEAELSTGMGNIEIEQLTATEASLEADMGAIDVHSFEVQDMDVSADMGSVELEGVLGRSFEGEANMGSIIMTLNQPVTDFNYQIETSMGSVVLDGESYTKLNKKMVINNMAQRSMELEASMGSIEISFK